MTLAKIPWMDGVRRGSCSESRRRSVDRADCRFAPRFFFEPRHGNTRPAIAIARIRRGAMEKAM